MKKLPTRHDCVASLKLAQHMREKAAEDYSKNRESVKFIDTLSFWETVCFSLQRSIIFFPDGLQATQVSTDESVYYPVNIGENTVSELSKVLIDDVNKTRND